MEKVSIIIPVYNGEYTIEQTIKSALNQTYENVQIVVINDGSKDNTASICERLAEQHSNIILIHKENGGVSAARNTGLERAEGKYIAFLDADDTIEPDFCEKLVQAIESEHAQMAVCGYYNESEKDITEWMPQKWSSSQQCAEGLIKTGGIYYIWNKLFLKEKITHSFDVNKSMSEDLEFVCNYMTGIEKTASVQECLYHYQADNTASLTHTVKMSPLQILEEYENLKCFVDKMHIEIEGFENRLVFATIYKLRAEHYKDFRLKWKQFRDREGFHKLVKAYKPTRASYKMIAFLVRYNMPLITYFIMKVKL